jgi:hypothetical protein
MELESVLKKILAGQEQMARELADLTIQVKKLKKQKKKTRAEQLPPLSADELEDKVKSMLSTMTDVISKKDDIERIKALATSKDPNKQNIVNADPGKMLKAHTLKLAVDEIELLKDYVYHMMSDRRIEMTQGMAVSRALKLLFKDMTIPPRPARVRAAEKIAIGNQILGKARKLKSLISERKNEEGQEPAKKID